MTTTRTLTLCLLVGGLVGCASPVVRHVGPDNESVDGVRVRALRPYEVLIYSVGDSGTLSLRQRSVDLLPDPAVVYAIDYHGALVSSSKFKVTFNPNGGVASVRVETTRTLKDSAEAAQSVSDQVSRLRQAERDREDRENKKAAEIDRLKAIKDYREAYRAATSVPPAPGEPTLIDGSALTGGR